MADQEQVLIEVKFDTSAVEKARAALAANLKQLQSNRQELKALNDKVKENQELTAQEAARYAELNKAIDANKREIKSNTAILQAASTTREEMSATLDQQRQYVNILQKAFAGLTEEQKAAMGGEEALQNTIKALTDSLREQEHAIGDDRRNVGNYTESIMNAFGEMAHAGELLSPAIGLLRGMGGEGKKAAAALDALSKVMQLAGKAGKVFATAQKAQTAATEGATIAQEGLNAAMAANPIGLIIAGISTLLPLVQSIIDAFGDASGEIEAFNNELERQNRIISQLQSDAEFEAKVAGIYGASAAEQLKIRRDAAKEALRIADEEVDRLWVIRKKGSDKEKEAAAEAMKEAEQRQKEAQDRLNALNQELTLQTLRDKQAEEDKKTEIAKKGQEQRQKDREEAAAEEREWEINQAEARLALARMNAEQQIQQDIELQQQAKEMLAALDEEEEEEENIPTLDEMTRDMWGLDEESIEYFKQLLDEGVSFTEAKTQAIENQAKRMTKAWASSFGSLSGTFNQMSDIFGEFAEQSEEAAAAQKAFALMGIITDQAQSIANGALAVSEGIASASSLPFPANIPAIISIVATIGGLMAGVASSIVQAKKLFSSADAGKFATGGIVGGTSYSGDNMVAHVNSREMILPMDAQKNLFDALTGSDNGNAKLGIDYERMAAAFAAAPAPNLVLTELAQEQEKIVTYNEIAEV